MEKYFDATGSFDLGLWEALGFQFRYASGEWVGGHPIDRNVSRRAGATCESGGYAFSLGFHRWRLLYGPPESAMAEVSGDGLRGPRNFEHHVVSQDEALNWFCSFSDDFRARAIAIVGAWQADPSEFARRSREAGGVGWV